MEADHSGLPLLIQRPPKEVKPAEASACAPRPGIVEPRIRPHSKVVLSRGCGGPARSSSNSKVNCSAVWWWCLLWARPALQKAEADVASVLSLTSSMALGGRRYSPAPAAAASREGSAASPLDKTLPCEPEEGALVVGSVRFTSSISKQAFATADGDSFVPATATKVEEEPATFDWRPVSLPSSRRLLQHLAAVQDAQQTRQKARPTAGKKNQPTPAPCTSVDCAASHACGTDPFPSCAEGSCGGSCSSGCCPCSERPLKAEGEELLGGSEELACCPPSPSAAPAYPSPE